MKKLRLLSVFLCILAVTVASCDSVDFGDINEDDDAPQEANVEGMMAGGMNQFFTNAGRSYFNNPTLYVQYQTQSTYTTEMTYGENPYGWSAYYSGVLSNFDEIYEITKDAQDNPDIEAFGAAENQAAVAEIMSAVVFKRVTDTWGDIPYSSADGSLGEGLDAQNDKAPAYTSQEEVYKDLINRVKAARDMISPGEDGPTGDVLYGGDMPSWQKFANSLILQMSLQLSDKYPSASGYAAQEFNAALSHGAGVIEAVGEEAWYNHQNSSGALNPLSRNRSSDYYLADSFTDALEGDTNGDSTIVHSNTTFDDRLLVFSSDTSSSGGRYGIDKISNSGASVGGDIWTGDGDLPYMTAAYTYLNRAEAALKGWTGEDEATLLQEGIEASYASISANWAELPTDGSAFAAQRVIDAQPGGNADDGFAQVIAEEKWAALFPMGFDAWAEWRRTTDDKNWGNNRGGSYPYEAKGYPGLYPAIDATNGGEVPRRYIYPSTEGGVNTGNYEDALQSLSPAEDNNTSEIWWDQ